MFICKRRLSVLLCSSESRWFTVSPAKGVALSAHTDFFMKQAKEIVSFLEVLWKCNRSYYFLGLYVRCFYLLPSHNFQSLQAGEALGEKCEGGPLRGKERQKYSQSVFHQSAFRRELQLVCSFNSCNESSVCVRMCV